MKTIETKKAASVQEVVELIRRLNFRNDTFEYRFTTRERVNGVKIEYRQFDAYLPNGEKDSFAIDEIVVNGKLEVVRFFNLFRDITVDFRLGDFTPDYSKDEQVIDADAQIALANVTDVPETDGSEEDDDDNVFALVPELDELNDVDTEENVIVDVAADFDDSLIRGMKFSLEKIQALCLSINRSKQTDLTAVSYEWELYNIQRKALFRKKGA